MSDFLNAHVFKIDYFKVKSRQPTVGPSTTFATGGPPAIRQSHQQRSAGVAAGGPPAVCYLGNLTIN